MTLAAQSLGPAPTFTPTLEEFSDPIRYINKVSGLARSYGIFKIRPPQCWRPPFCANPNATFTPRIQNLSDLHAFNRVRTEFTTSLVNFWEAQNVKLFAPFVKRKLLDLYQLWKFVHSKGGFESVCEQKLWTCVSQQLGFGSIPSHAAVICSKYKRILYPYDRFLEQRKASEEGKSVGSDNPIRKVPIQKKRLKRRNMVCMVCRTSKDEDRLLLCDGCDSLGICHTYCLQPPLSDIPKGDWFCPSCVAKRFRRLHHDETFGFSYSDRRRTLAKFGDFADGFKSKHFGKPAHLISLDEVEKEFWRIMDCQDSGITVEYGADLNARDFGSGFPYKGDRQNAERKKYAESPWNLNNLPVNDLSALRFLPSDISGMIIPWCYVGMVFSCFCWHIEDHWSYSINYLHSGSPKTWYGVPTASADAFEAAMRTEVPELFESSPDLLHHMTTMLPPDRLTAHGVPVYKLDQCAGEFVVTFPRAYHAGFNQGFNFAEAVNFCPADWFEMGQYCIEHYAVVHRAPVFSHAELLCRMAESTEPLSVDFLTVVTKQLKDLLATERSLRRHVARLGVRRAERLVFENSEDDKRECDLCRTTLYLSALACKCSPSMVCLAHHQARTCCPHEEQIMRYRYGLDELSESIDKLEGQLEEYRRWKVDVERITQWSITFLPDNNPLPNSFQVTPTQDEADCRGLDEAERIGVDQTDEISEESAPSNEPKPPVVGCLVPDSREDVQSQSEDSQKPNMNQLSKLIEVGQSRKYPPADIDPLLNLSLFIRECSELLHGILHTHGRAIEGGCAISKVDVTDSGCSSSSLVEDGSSDTDTSMASDVESSESTIASPHLPSVTDYSATVGKASASPKPEAGRSPKKPTASACRKKRSKLSLDEFFELIQVASKIRVFLPELDQLEALGTWITDWRSRANKVIQQCNAPALSDTEETDVPTVNVVRQLLDQAEMIHMDLPETIYLKRIYDCLEWKEQVETTLASSNKEILTNEETTPSNKPSLTDLCDLQFHGDLISATIAYVKIPDAVKLEDDTPDALPSPTFPDKSRLDVVLINTSRHLLSIIKSAKIIEDRLIAIQNSKSGSLSVDDVLSEIAEAESLPAQLPIIADIRSMCVQAKQLEVQFKQMERLLIAVPPGQPFPPVTISEDLYEKLRMGTVDCSAETWKACVQSLLDVEHPFPLNCPRFQHVTEMLNILVQFRDRLTRLFLWPQSKMHLLEVLLPRSVRSIEMLLELDNARSSDSSWSTYTKRGSRNASLNATTYWTLSKENACSFAEADVTCSNAAQLYRSVYSAFIDSELNLMHHLRCSNAFKSKSKAQNSVTYCICRKTGFSGFMVQCELCRDWFHGRCVLPPNMKESETDRLRYMCPRCERSMRPDLTHVHALLDDLVRILPIEATTQPTPTSASTRRPFCLPRLPEFVALQMLCERAVSFVRRLRSVIQSTPELSQAVCKYEQFAGLKMPLFGFVEEDGQLAKLDDAVSSDTSQLLGHPIRTYQSSSKATGSRDGQPRRPLSGLTRPGRTTVDSIVSAEESETPSSAGVISLIGPEHCWKATSHKESAGNLTSEVAAMTAGHMASRSRTDSQQGLLSQKTICSLQTQAERRMLMEGPSSLQKAGLRSGALGDPTLVPRTYDRRPQSTSLATSKVRPSATDQAKYFFCPLAPETRQILENLMMEASLLEVSIPQTRWLWQLHLASDPETPIGATRPYVARRDELRWKRRRFRHQRLIRPPFISARQERRKRPQPPGDDTTLQSGEASSNSADSECSASSSPATIREGKRMRTKDGVTSERSRSSSVSSLSADQSAKRSVKPRTFRRNLSSGISKNQENPSSRLSQTVHRKLLSRGTRVGSVPSRSRLSKQVGGSSRYTYGSTTYRRRLPVTNKQPGKRSGESNPFAPRPRPNVKVQRNRPTHRSVNTQHSPNKDRPSVDVPEARASSSHSASHKSHAEKRRVAPFNSNSSSRRLKGRRIGEPGDLPKKRNASSADEDECAAAVCQNPRGGTVEWIACDSCERWFHQLCVGIRHKSQVPKEYACARCLQRYQARLARIRYKQRVTSRLGRPYVADRSFVEEHHTASMRMRQFPRRRSLLESCSIQRPIGWNSSSRPVGFTSSEHVFREGNVTSTNSAATAVEASSEGASMETDGVQIDPWADYSPDPDTELTAHGNSVSEHNPEDAVQSFSFKTEQYVHASEVQAPCHLDSKNPTEILLEAIEVVKASGGSVAPASSDIYSGPTA
ncbi:hypothetical protein CRM22_003003 [Opisthorchis felineus]|uniref:[histone H3]-trimethyl-L-lysine(4) demethylase n=1 Tax=Opisthorchis felineus TaxID=147828 RepID=A0A4V3SG30_OPIFE|nr:hypothetical protein CRM22_003003 [Opisthorchis felineus]